jgi:TP901 family phage tail tape measure protein
VALPPLVAVLTANISEFESAMGRAGALVGEGSALSGAFKGMSVLGGVAVVGLGLVAEHSIKAAAAFDASMTRISTQAHVPLKDIKGLEDGVLELAGKVGQSPDSLAEALYHVESNFASLGIKGPEALHAVQVAAEGAKVGGAKVVDVTNALTAVLAAGLPGVNNMEQAMGALNATVGAGDMSMQDLADAFGTGVISVAKGFGASIQDVGAALAVFGDNNKRGADAGTQLRMVLTSLGKPISGSSDGLKKLGLASDQLSKDMQKGGLKLALTDLMDHMKAAGISAENSSGIITDVFGRKAGVGLNMLVGEFDRMLSKYPEINKGATEFGQAWKDTTETFQFKMDAVTAKIDALGIKLGNFLIPYVEKATDAIMKGVEWLEKHKEVAEGLAVAVGTVLVVAIGSFIGSMIVAAAPIAAVILGIGALAYGLKWAYDNFKPVRDIVGEVSDWFTHKLVPALEGAWNSIVNHLKPGLQDLEESWQRNQYWIKPTIDFIEKLTAKYIELEGSALVWVIEKLGWFVGTTAEGTLHFFSRMLDVIGWIVDKCKDLYHWFGNLSSTFSGMGGFFSDVGSSLGSLGGLMGFDDGGWVPGAAGAPMLAVVHGGEYVVSRDMMSGPSSSSYSSSPGGGSIPSQRSGSTMIQNVIMIDGQQIQPVMQRQTVFYGIRNGNTGLAVPAGRS